MSSDPNPRVSSDDKDTLHDNKLPSSIFRNANKKKGIPSGLWQTDKDIYP
jgi:hypothetical protein